MDLLIYYWITFEFDISLELCIAWAFIVKFIRFDYTNRHKSRYFCDNFRISFYALNKHSQIRNSPVKGFLYRNDEASSLIKTHSYVHCFDIASINAKGITAALFLFSTKERLA